MIGILKQKNPGNALILLVYALVLKFPLFSHPRLPVLQTGDNFLYKLVLQGLYAISNRTPLVFSLISLLLLFSQATLFNRIFNYHKLLPKANFLAGMSYILITSLLPSWNYFSAPLLLNSMMIWIWYRMISLYNDPRPDSTIFTIGLLTGIGSLVYVPGLFLLLLVFLALSIMRPFRLREYMMGLFGFTVPYYFLFIFLYISNQWSWKNMIPSFSFGLPALPHSIWITLGMTLLILPFLIGGYFVQANLSKMLIQVRKSWSLTLLFLMVAALVILFNRADFYENWMMTLLAFAAFHAAAYFYFSDKMMPRIIHWITFCYIIWVNYLL